MKKAYTMLWGFCFLFFLGTAANGAIFTVTKTADTNDGICDSDCSLREAVAAGIDNGAPTAVVVFSQSLAGSTISITAGEINVDAVKIIGLGADRLTISGNNSSRIFYSLTSVFVSGVTLTGGNGVGAGTGGIGGGAVRSEGTITIDGLVFTGNSLATGLGSATYCTAGGKIANSTFLNNTGTMIYISGSNATMRFYNSTLLGGGFAINFVGTTFNARNSTVTGDIAIGGLSNLDSANSIIGHVVRGSLLGGFTSSGNNIIVNPNNTNDPITYDASDMLGVDPQLADPALNGGHTPVLALLPTSPAIDAGNNALVPAELVFDQRRSTRIADGNSDKTVTVDIGAYEAGGSAAPNVIFAGQIHDGNGYAVSGAAMKIIDASGQLQSANTSPLGYFYFTNVAPGSVYVDISAKRHRYNADFMVVTQSTTTVEIGVQ